MNKVLYRFLLFFLIRLVYAVLQRTYFVPDEHWQVSEVAHRVVFGTGGQTWEWHSDVAIRSYLHPLLFSIPYYIARFFNMDSDLFIAYGPRLFQAVFAACGDVAYHSIAKSLFGFEVAVWSTTLYLTNWFSVFALGRTLGNSIACSVTLVALALHFEGHRVLGAAFAGFAVALRQTSALFLAPFYLCTISRIRDYWKSILVGCLMLSSGILIDSLYYTPPYDTQQLLPIRITAINFFKINFARGLSSLYGEHVAVWYFLVGIPFFFLGGLLSFLSCFWHRPLTDQRWLAIIIGCCFEIGLLSFSGHKELRFVMTSLVCLSMVSGTPQSSRRGSRATKLTTWLILIPHALVAVFFSRWYCAGADRLMRDLRRELRVTKSRPTRVMFLTACHGTPYHAYLHEASVSSSVELDFLDCAPRCFAGRPCEGRSDRVEFFESPKEWTRRNLDRITNSSFLVLYSPVETDAAFMADLEDLGFTKISVVFDSLLNEAPGEKSSVVRDAKFTLLKWRNPR